MPPAPGSWELVDVGHGRCEEQKLQMLQAVTKVMDARGDSAAGPPLLLYLPSCYPQSPGGSEGGSHGFHGGVRWGRQQVQREREEPRLGVDCQPPGFWVCGWGHRGPEGLSAGGLGHWEGLSWEGPVRTAGPLGWRGRG